MLYIKAVVGLRDRLKAEPTLLGVFKLTVAAEGWGEGPILKLAEVARALLLKFPKIFMASYSSGGVVERLDRGQAGAYSCSVQNYATPQVKVRHPIPSPHLI